MTRGLAQTVQAARRQAPGLGETIAIDATHSSAHVRENNPKEAIAHRFAAARRAKGDRDCALGVKARGNQPGAAETYLFGDGCGMAAAPTPLGDVVLAVHTQPFNHQDITHFRPLYADVVAVLGAPPTHLAAAAAFDAWYVSDAGMSAGGIAALAPNRRGPVPPHSPQGHPLCARGLAMTPASIGRHEDGDRIQRYRCPLRGTDALCDHARFARGGCPKRINIEPGGRRRATIAPIRPTGPSTASAPAWSASLARPTRSGSNDPSCAPSRRSRASPSSPPSPSICASSRAPSPAIHPPT